MQMMLSSLLHHTGYNEQLYKPSLVGGGLYGMSGGHTCGLEMPSRSAMPSISRLQQHVEWAWGQGFDLQGCDQLGGKLFNTRKWIGATEVVTVLSSLRIRLVFFLLISILYEYYYAILVPAVSASRKFVTEYVAIVKNMKKGTEQ